MKVTRRRTVLLAEDDRFLREYLRDKLVDRGLYVLEAGNERDAITAIESKTVKLDVAVLDVRMPSFLGRRNSNSEIGRTTGIRLARRIRKHSQAVKLIGISYFADEDVRQWFDEYGYCFIPKNSLIDDPRSIDLIEAVAKRRRYKKKPKSFIVHGHDNEMLFALKDYVHHTLRWPAPVVLRELPSHGRTIIEKFEDAARRIDLVFVLLTPDDKAATRRAPDSMKLRARQNVIFELGYFFAKMQRAGGRVLLLHKGKLELPSDIQGITYVDASNGIAACGEELRRELQAWM